MTIPYCADCQAYIMTTWKFCPFCGKAHEREKFELPQQKTTGELAKEAGAK